MNDPEIIRRVAGTLALTYFAAYFLYILSLSRALRKCSPPFRKIQSETLWLLLIPFINFIWHFFVVLGLAKSLGNEFRARNISNVEREPGKSIGIAMCVCGVCSFIPILGALIALVHIILWTIYWAKISEYSRRLDNIPLTQVMPTSIPPI